MPPKKMTATDQKRYAEMVQVASETLWDFRHPDFVKSILPREWSDIPLDAVPEKVRITLRVDADVAKFFRKLGRGVYQDRMNTVLRTFMLARLTEVLGTDEGPRRTSWESCTCHRKRICWQRWRSYGGNGWGLGEVKDPIFIELAGGLANQ